MAEVSALDQTISARRRQTRSSIYRYLYEAGVPCSKQQIAAAEYYPPAARFTDNIMQIVSSGPFGKWRTLLQADIYAIARARRRVWIQTPYYLPSDVLNSALQEAALAGIDVRLMLPARSDSKVVDLATHSYLDDMMKAGVKILFYMPGFLHSKLLIIDDMGTEMGTAFTVSALYNLINNRLMAHRPMIVNTNLLPDELKKRYSPAVASRLLGEFKQLRFFGDDIRMLKSRMQNR